MATQSVVWTCEGVAWVHTATLLREREQLVQREPASGQSKEKLFFSFMFPLYKFSSFLASKRVFLFRALAPPG